MAYEQLNTLTTSQPRSCISSMHHLDGPSVLWVHRGLHFEKQFYLISLQKTLLLVIHSLDLTGAYVEIKHVTRTSVAL